MATKDKDVEEKALTLKEAVAAVLELAGGYIAKFNNARTISVIDLGTQGAHQGTRYRQLYVECVFGYMTVSLREGFKSVHGGEQKPKILNMFRIPLYETEVFKMLQDRFFKYNMQEHIDNANALVDGLTKTVKL